MHYWIDGYNLLFRIPHLQGSLEEKRRQLILELNALAKGSDLSFILVFDANDNERPLDRRTHYDAIEIVYTTSKKTADEAILEGVENSRHRAKICVVSSDKGLTYQVKALGAGVLSLSEFCLFLNKKRLKKHRLTPQIECKESPKEMARLLKIFEEKFKAGL